MSTLVGCLSCFVQAASSCTIRPNPQHHSKPDPRLDSTRLLGALSNERPYRDPISYVWYRRHFGSALTLCSDRVETPNGRPTMKRTRKTQTFEPSPRDRLTSQFIQALEKDWAEHGPSIIEKLREKHLERYADIVARLVAP